MLAIKSVQLVQALSRLEGMFDQVLLGDKRRLCLGDILMNDLDTLFMHHDFTVRGFQQGLKVMRARLTMLRGPVNAFSASIWRVMLVLQLFIRYEVQWRS